MKINNVKNFEVVSRDTCGYIGIIQNKRTKKLYSDGTFLEHQELYKGMNLIPCDVYLAVGEDDGDYLLVKLGDTDMKVYRKRPGCLIDNETGEVAVELGYTIGFKYVDMDRECPIYVITNTKIKLRPKI